MFRWLTMCLLLILPCSVALSACPAGRGGARTDDDDYFDDDDDADRAATRRRKRRRSRRTSRRRRRSRSRSRSARRDVPVLIDAKRLRDAVVETTTSGQPREDIARLRRTFCEGREDDAVVFYQLVVSTHWHYYWICSDRRPQRAATSVGSSRLSTWVRRVERRAASEGAVCTSGSQRVLFRETHESGARAKASCDGRIVIRFPDRFKVTRFFTPGGGGSRYASRRTAPTNNSSGGVYQRCPPCRCPRSSSAGDCPQPRPCPPPRQCPRCPVADCRAKELAGKKAGFWMGVGKACQRICGLIYKKCRSINSKTAMCHMLQGFCEQNCSKRK
ncbi:MAG: hypothetical protein KC503_11010 [Myxococcales bacterium]|nr:hypothetical protein [Myxococcales bacterium]